MIIRKVRLAPFGAAVDQSYRFEKGLNVLLGPNEAGKSTLVKAVYALLFIPSSVKKSSEDWKNFLQDCLPYPEGDTVRVEIEIEVAGERFSYRSTWGAIKEEQMIPAGGSEINDPQEARKRLSQALRFGAGTYKGVLFAGQEEMNRTFERLKENREALGSVSDLLRSALHESGGVSLEDLEAKINQEHIRLLQNWDPGLDGPRGGRDINNPHKRNVGAILAAYYRREEVRRRLKETQAMEERITTLNQELIEQNRELASTLARLKEMEDLEEDIRQRSGLEPRLESVQEKEAGLKDVLAEWPRIEERVKGLEREIEAGRHRCDDLQKELQETEAVIENRRKRELLQKAGPLREEIKESEAHLKKLPGVGKDELEYLEQRNRDRVRLKELAEAMKIKASLHTKTPLNLIVTSGLDQAKKIEVDKEAFLEGAGRLILKSDQWTLNIQAGDEDVDDLINRAERAGEEFAEKLKELSLDDLEQARETAARREELQKKIQSARIRLESCLGQLSLEELEKEVTKAGPDKNVRDPEQVKADLEEVKLNLNSSSYRLDQEKDKLRQWAEKYDSYDQALDQLAELRRQSGELKESLKGLAPLPEEYASAEQFMTVLKETRRLGQAIKERILDLKTELAELQARMPEESTEELQGAFQQAGEQLEKLKGQGRAIELVRNEFYELKKELDAHTYAPLEESLAGYLALATNNRYRRAELDGALPGTITSAEGNTLPVSLLSAGTTSGAALALRLALAEYLLQGAEGFLIMDDPLVNLDPGRKQSAARAIQEFGRKKQVLIATCDPGTADLLGGNLVPV